MAYFRLVLILLLLLILIIMFLNINKQNFSNCNYTPPKETKQGVCFYKSWPLDKNLYNRKNNNLLNWNNRPNEYKVPKCGIQNITLVRFPVTKEQFDYLEKHTPGILYPLDGYAYYIKRTAFECMDDNVHSFLLGHYRRTRNSFGSESGKNNWSFTIPRSDIWSIKLDRSRFDLNFLNKNLKGNWRGGPTSWDIRISPLHTTKGQYLPFWNDEDKKNHNKIIEECLVRKGLLSFNSTPEKYQHRIMVQLGNHGQLNNNISTNWRNNTNNYIKLSFFSSDPDRIITYIKSNKKWPGTFIDFEIKYQSNIDLFFNFTGKHRRGFYLWEARNGHREYNPNQKYNGHKNVIHGGWAGHRCINKTPCKDFNDYKNKRRCCRYILPKTIDGERHLFGRLHLQNWKNRSSTNMTDVFESKINFYVRNAENKPPHLYWGTTNINIAQEFGYINPLVVA